MWGKTGSLLWPTAAWSPRDNLSSLSPGPGSFFIWEPLGTPDELFWCCNLPTVATSFRAPFLQRHSGWEEVAGPQKDQPFQCWFPNHPRWLYHLSQVTGKGHMCHTCSRSGAPQCLQEARDKLYLAVWVCWFDEERERTPSPLLLLQEHAGLF